MFDPTQEKYQYLLLAVFVAFRDKVVVEAVVSAVVVLEPCALAVIVALVMVCFDTPPFVVVLVGSCCSLTRRRVTGWTFWRGSCCIRAVAIVNKPDSNMTIVRRGRCMLAVCSYTERGGMYAAVSHNKRCSLTHFACVVGDLKRRYNVEEERENNPMGYTSTGKIFNVARN